MGIAETWLNENISLAEIEVEGYTIYRKDRENVKTGKAGGVALYVHNSLQSRINVELNKYRSESLWCNILIDKKQEICVGVCYKSTSANEEEVNQLLSAIFDASSKSVLIMGDFNFPKIDWKQMQPVNV